jgi:PEP-CTERM/exosortase A-associated glycosyltransferase
MTLKVLHVLDHSIPLHSGYSFRTLSILREQHKLGWQTLQVTTPKQGESPADEETIDGLTFLRTGSEATPGLFSQMRLTAGRLRHGIERLEPDLIHAHSPLLTALPSLFVARQYDLPVVYEMRASWEDASVDHGTTTEGSLRYRLSKTAESFVLRRAHHVTTICEGLRQEIAARGVPANRVTVIPNAVDIDRFVYHGGSDIQAKQRLGLKSDATVGFIGSFYGYEGLDDLIEAMVLLRDRGVAVQAVLVGGGPEDNALRAMVEQSGLQDRVRFIGRVSHDEVQEYYRAIDVLVYPRKRTRLTEMVTPLKPLEAMAQGNLVLASDVGGHLELIQNGETGILFPADDVVALASVIESTLDSRDGWENMRANGLEFVTQERNWELSVSGYRRAYGAALAAKGCNADFPTEGDL